LGLGARARHLALLDEARLVLRIMVGKGVTRRAQPRVLVNLQILGGLVLAGLLVRLLHDLALLLEHLFVEVLVVVVAREGLLHVLLVQQEHVLLDLLAILVLPLPVGVVGVEVVLVGRDERRLKPLVQEVVPGEVPQPRMIFDIVRPV